MRTKNIEVDGKMVEAQIFDSMWEYVSHYGSDITHYRKQIPNEGAKIALPFRPIDDVEFSTHSSDLVEIDGIAYQRVWWGEAEVCMIPEADLTAALWAVYEWDDCMYAATGAIFQTEEEARKEVA
jgi:hypothetical protein